MQSGITARRVVGLVSRNSPDFFDSFHRLVLEGACVVPLRSADDEPRISATGVTEVVVPQDGFGWTTWTGTLPADDRLAQIAFTSGTQGPPKGVLLSLGNLGNTAMRLGSALRLDASARIYIGAPVFHSFGASCCRAVAAVGGASYVPRNGFNPLEIASLLDRGEINGIAAVPTMWRLLFQHGDLLGDLGRRVRWILIGSQPMGRDEKLLMRRLFPGARIIHHYGLTEASSSTFLDVSDAPEELLESAGVAQFGVEVRITADGRIAIRGPNVARQLLVDGQLVANVDAEGWFVTNDAGELQDGHLFFLGRLDDVINAGGIKLSADAIEEKISAALAIPRQLSVVRIPDRDRGDGVLLAVTEDCARSDPEILACADTALRESGVVAPTALRLMRVPDLPRTETDKVQRAALARRYAEDQARAGAQPAGDPTGRQGALARRLGALRSALAPRRARPGVRPIFEDAFPGVAIRDTDSFVSLGGDSLSFVSVSIALEGQLGHLPEDWENLGIAQLEAIRPRTSRFRMTDTTLVLRFVGIVSIVYFHFMPSGLGGATFLLMLAVGYNFSRFQLENVLRENSVAPLLLSAARIALPLFLVVAAIEARKADFDPLALLLLGNFKPAPERILDYWFVEVTIQIMLIMACLLAFPSVRRVVGTRPSAFAWGLLAVSVALATLGPLAWDTTPYYDRLPHMILWLFALGMVVDLARTRADRIRVSAVILAVPLIVWGPGPHPFWIAHGQLWLWIGGLVLLWFETIPLPAIVSRAAHYVGGASMFIYITHFSVQGLWDRLVPFAPRIFDVIVAIVVGVLIWLAWDALFLSVRRRMRTWAGSSARFRKLLGTATSRGDPTS
jgi:acyl-CoA synthetase (AMP-forming)/AMP-acid ligase II